MKKLGCVLLSAGLLLCVASLQAAAGTQEQAESEGTAAEAPAIGEPIKPPRIPGRAQSQAEWDAWQLVVQGATSAQKADLAKGFLETYPTSGLSANAHYFIAQNYYETGDTENFILHAEKSLEELPNSVTFLTQLGFFYAERGESEKAMERAEQALELLDNLPRPVEVPVQDFVVQSRLLRADAKYALGRSHLNQIASDSEDRSSDPHLMKAMVNLKESLRMDPKHDYASFRLGFAFRNMNNAEGAMKAYARAAVLGGVAAQPARTELEDILVEGMREQGFRTLLPDELQAPIIVTFHMPDNPRFDFDRFYDRLSSRGYVIYPGKLTVADSFRIGCIGRLGAPEMRGALAAIREAMEEFEA